MSAKKTRAAPSAPHGAVAFAAARCEALEQAVDLARLAPSIHNTQPWTLRLGDDALILSADRSRQARAIDPLGRAMVQSVGAALFNARVGLAAAGWAAQVDRVPSPDQPDVLARIRPVSGPPDGDLAALAPLVRRRHTNRRAFAADPLPEDLLRHLTRLAAADGTRLVPVLREEHRALVGRLTRQADRIQNADPAYRAELRRWTSRAAAAGDGVPPAAVPHVDGEQDDDLPIRDFDTQGTGALPPETRSGTAQALVLLATDVDEPLAWLRAGEALEHLLLELTRLDWKASPVTQAVEVPLTRTQLRSALTWHAHPQVLLRIGRAAATVATPRRRRAEVLHDSSHPDTPIPVPAPPLPVEPPRFGAALRRPVPDGRGGTTWR